MKKIIKITLSSLMVLLLVAMFSSKPIQSNVDDTTFEFGNHSFDPITPSTLDTSYVTYTNFRLNIANAASTAASIITNMAGKKVRIDTAEELYRFSVDVSYHADQIYITGNPTEDVKLSSDKIGALLSLDYVLGNDIDYSVMQSRQFIPIGYSFYSLNLTLNENKFTGTFDGRGFEISNLYFAGYNLLTTIEGTGEEAQDLAITPYYAMFTFNEGEIKNLGLINPTLEIKYEHEDLTKAATLVGKNSGIVDHVYVIDARTSATTAGIRMKAATGIGVSSYEAAGVIYNNTGTFTNAYYVSPVVVNASYITNFQVQPVLFYNTGTATNLYYDQTVYLTTINISGQTFNVNAVNGLNTPKTTTQLKTGLATGNWFYYASDRYPSLMGLVYSSGSYLIYDAIDLIAFSKMINYITVKNGQPFRQSDYLVMDDLDMSQVAAGAYKTPEIEFSGSLKGNSLVGNYYIKNLALTNGTAFSEYYAGLFSVLSGEVSYLTFSNASITITNSATYYSLPFYIGVVAGKLDNGIVSNVSVSANIQLGSTSIGETSVGSIVGEASGTITNVYAEGTLNAGEHTFTTGQSVIPTYSIGGLVGKTGATALSLYNGLNHTTITGISTTASVTTTPVSIRLGGVVGYVENTSTIKHMIGLVSNNATITPKTYLASSTVSQYVAGVIGLSAGASNELTNQFGLWTNDGLLDFTQRGSNTIYSAGVVVTNHTAQSEYIFLYNHETFTTSSYTGLTYTTLLLNLSTSGITLSQSENTADTDINTRIDFSGVYHSTEDATSLLRFVENSGDIIFHPTTLTTETKISGITLSNNVDFLNVTMSGDIKAYNIGTSAQLWLAGFSTNLSAGRYIKNGLHDGNIIIGGINSSTNESTAQNIYLGGFVNINQSGDLNQQDGSNLPKATIGIINSVNNGDFLSKYDNTYYGVSGAANVFVGGISTLNSGSIQDSVNLGHIKVSNTSGYVSSAVTYNPDSSYGGRVTKFRYAVIAGGVSAAVTAGTSRIYDVVNSGDIIAISANFTRSGGILAQALYEELQSGLVSSTLFSTTIPSSILSNSLNYGSVVALTQNIHIYSTTPYNLTTTYFFNGSQRNSTGVSNLTTTYGTEERPGISASAGGVIGYGLSVMRRMINHGEVSSTDVAGGIVGASFVWESDATTVVYIDTALNYGSIRAINNNLYSQIDKKDIEYTQIQSAFYAVDSTFIFPTPASSAGDLRKFPEGKRGIGGIFGRLQRGVNQVMTSAGGTFDFIVNFDENVDLIGRLDQVMNWTSSSRFFRFNNAKYYSAKYNDTTQGVFTGYYYFYDSSSSNIQRTTRYRTYILKERYTYENRSGTWYLVTDRYYENRSDVEHYGVLSRQVGSTMNTLGVQTRIREYSSVTASGWYFYQEQALPAGTYTAGTTEQLINPIVTLNSSSSTANLGSPYYFFNDVLPVPVITEDDDFAWMGDYAYDPNFEMRDDSTLLSNGQPITSYIYYAENGLLASRFSSSRTNGMYVLSTSSGSAFGSVLPANLVLTNLYPLDGMQPYNTNYETTINRVPIDPIISTAYYGLLQTAYSDKSALLETNQYVAMSENGGSQTKLLNPTIDYNNKIITFTLSLDLIASGQTSISYQLTDALIPANALIAERISDYYSGSPINYAEYQDLLEAEADSGIASTLAPVLTTTLPNVPNGGSQTITLGYFTSYSEAAVYNAAFINSTYTTDYQVRLNVLGRASSLPQPYLYSIDGGTTASFTENQVFTQPVSSTLRLMFDDQSPFVLNTGADIKEFIRLEYQNELVELSDYGLTTVPVYGQWNDFEFTITLNPNLRDGEYKVYYKYYYADTEKVITFTKASSTASNIESLSYYSSGTVTPVGTTFTSYVDFGFDLGFSSVTFTPNTNTDPLLKPYQDNMSYDISFMDSFTLAPFATLISTTYNGVSYVNGYRVYQLLYTIESESGVQTVYTHNIQERPIDITNIYKNNNKVLISNVFATREALQTNFAVDFGINELVSEQMYNLFEDDPNAYFSITVDAVDYDLNPMPALDIKGITYSADSFLNIIMSNQTLPGFYTFTFEYIRAGNAIQFTQLVIEKKEGISAYLTDIQFSESATETDYADMSVANPDGSVDTTSTYDPSIYFAGIDYDGSQNIVFNYRVDGQVSNTPLNEFIPFFLEFLPAGATISRKVYPLENPSISWTSEVTNASDPAIKAELAADFTIMPDTGLEPTELEDVVITYRVTSENGLNVVYYHITVIDIIYNVSLIFDVYYDDNGVPIEAANSELANKVVLINVRNFNTDVAVTTSLAPTVADFPTFTTIGTTNNSIYMFYVGNNSNYRYRYGRNISGFYGFEVLLPKDPNGNDYTYYITFDGDTLSDLSSYVTGTTGKYFYINGGTKNRTRRFEIHVVRTNQSIDNGWGLDDDSDTYFD